MRLCIRGAFVALLIYGGLLWLTYIGFRTVPTGFVPSQDKIFPLCILFVFLLRPIMMTSFAFILWVVPLMLSSGAGAEMRQTLGTGQG